MRKKSGCCSAYGGRGWKPRARHSREERASRYWSAYSVNSEYQQLRAVLLYRPGRELLEVRDPNRVQHLARIRPTRVTRELDRLASTFRRLGVQVHWIDRDAFPERHFNLMYVRDLFWMTPEGAVISRMASRVRAGEEKFAAHSLSMSAVPILRSIGGRGVFEGADALWVGPRTVLVGVGNRTNVDAYQQLRRTLAEQGVRCIRVALPRQVQHLLGLLQIVDRRKALLRTGVANPALRKTLHRLGFSIIEVPESEEVTRKQAMNIVTVAPGKVIMPSDCPGVRKLLVNCGIRIAAEVPISELIQGAGGIACATGILDRKPALP